jgi:hypothetical protein
MSPRTQPVRRWIVTVVVAVITASLGSSLAAPAHPGAQFKITAAVRTTAVTPGEAANPVGAVTPAQRGYRWYYVTALTGARMNLAEPVAYLSINGRTYRKSIKFNPIADLTFYEVNLRRRCTRLITVAGLVDDADSGTRANIEISTYVRSRYSKTFGLAQSQAVRLSLRSAFRLRVEATPQSEVHPYAGLGTPRVYCSF